MGLDELHLRVLSTSSDDPKERKNAQKGTSLANLSLTFVSRLPSLELALPGPPLGPCRTYPLLRPRRYTPSHCSPPRFSFLATSYVAFRCHPLLVNPFICPDRQREFAHLPRQRCMWSSFLPRPPAANHLQLGGGIPAVAMSTAMIGACLSSCLYTCPSSPPCDSHLRVCDDIIANVRTD